MSLVNGQNRYAKIIDIDNRPQVAKEILKYQNKFFIHHTGVCVDEDQQLLEACSGILLVDENVHIIDSQLIRKFSTGNESLVIDTINNRFYLSGEEDIKNDYPNRFTVYQIDPASLSLKNSYFLHDDNFEERKYFQITSTLFNNQLLVGGTKNELDRSGTVSLFFVKNKQNRDTIIYINLSNGTYIFNSLVNKDNQLAISVLSNERLNDRAHILKYDENFNVVWHWISERTQSTQVPYICETENGNIVVALSATGFNKIARLLCIREDQSIEWEFNFPGNSSKIQRKIFSLKRLRNGDIVGTGYFGNTTLNSGGTKILIVPYIFRLSSTGKLLWQKAFYRDRPVLDYCSGVFEDVVELDNGDLIAVGTIDNYLEYDPVVMQGRIDPDILIVRMDANGCIDDDCKMLTKIYPDTTSSTTNTRSEVEEAMLYPNPAHGGMYLLGNDEVSKITFYTLQGVLAHEIFKPGDEIILPNILSGLYFAHVHLKSGKVIKQKIVIQ
ncbi:MAG: T9SS type A sorting domain-containing protein [Chitinophagales bacterium]|nr:T9SS type A sorting domain-containing protein [Chitinophagales bacterium]